MPAYLLTIALSAALLFGVQPLISKVLLPRFGGSPTVWTTCMLFFQVLLLAGYAYAHWAASRLAPRTCARVHLGLLGLSLLWLPIGTSTGWPADPGADPTWPILGLLTLSVGLPYAVLSSTSPLLQRWFSLSYPGRSPYRLFALSNAGSLLALLAYPFVVEPALTVRRQLLVWSAAYAVFVVTCGWVAWRARVPTESVTPAQTPAALGPQPWILWLTLSACGSVLLLAVTNQLCQNVAVVPFLWVLPLVLYLLSFVLTFETRIAYSRRVWGLALMFGLLAASAVSRRGGGEVPLPRLVGAYAMMLFTGCMILHGELVRLRPPPTGLTRFYLMVSLGGALGGVAVTLLAPLLLSDYYELPLVLIATPLLLMACIWRDPGSPLRRGRRRIAWLAMALGVASLIHGQVRVYGFRLRDPIAVRRNFYGVLSVWEEHAGDPARHAVELSHGWIRHGLQLRSRPRLATTYFSPASGVGRILRHHPRRAAGPLRIGVVGLGAGTLAVYARPGDTLRFYELNPDNLALAQRHFTFLRDCQTRDVEHVTGDARVSLERELATVGSQRFDVLAIDAFSGDAVPAHLLTRECMDVFWRHLAPDGVLAFNVNNLFLDLKPVVLAMARSVGARALLIGNRADPAAARLPAYWTLIPRRAAALEHRQLRPAGRWLSELATPLEWTDDYAPLYTILKW